MANNILTISMITREATRMLENNLTFTKGVNRQYDDQFAKDGAKIGNTLNIRKPARYLGRSGSTLAVEDQTETSVPLVLNQQFGVDVQFTSTDLALSMDDFSKRFLAPAMATVANKIDADGLAMAMGVANSVGTIGTPLASLAIPLQAGAILDINGCPKDKDRSIVLDPFSQASMVQGLSGLFQSSEKIADQYETGNMGLAAGFKFSMDQNVGSYTVGPQGGTPAVNGAGQTGPSLVTNGWTAAAASRLNQGDVFTIAGVYAVNPQARKTTKQLQQFVVLSAVASDAGGNATISIYPAITPSGQFQNVSAAPAAGALLTVVGTAGQVGTVNLAYHRDAFTLGCADLPIPKGVDMAARVSDKQLGLSVRMVRQYDIVNDRFPCRLDILYGWKAIYPELACRILT